MTTVKLVVVRDGGNKTYDFEAEDAKKAGESCQVKRKRCVKLTNLWLNVKLAEIVACIKNLRSTAVERSGTVKQVGRNPRRTTKQ